MTDWTAQVWAGPVWPGPWPVAAALALEAAVGYPAWLHRRLPHPVALIGAALAGLEQRWNDPARSSRQRRVLGVIALLLVAGGAAATGAALQFAMTGVAGWAAFAVAASVGLAQRSLYHHVAAVARPLAGGDLDAARAAVAMIVGRDTAALDAEAVAAAAIESLAESFNDAVVAPTFWLLIGGLPGLFAYKAVNTADSMIGHIEPRWRAFGWAAARTDDVMNLIPARIAGLLVVAAGGGGLATMLRDAPAHASPNAGWPEAAMAGALRIRLGGDASYDGLPVSRPRFGTGPAAAPADIRRALAVYVRACILLILILLAGGLAWPR